MEKFEYALPLNMLIGSIFRQIRIANRLDQGDVAQVTTLLPSTISKIESNSVQLTVDFIFTLCTFYELTPSTLFLLVEEVISVLQTEHKIFKNTEKPSGGLNIGKTAVTLNVDEIITPFSLGVAGGALSAVAFAGGSILGILNDNKKPLKATSFTGSVLAGAAALLANPMTLSMGIASYTALKESKKNAEQVKLFALSSKHLNDILDELVKNGRILSNLTLISNEKKSLYKEIIKQRETLEKEHKDKDVID